MDYIIRADPDAFVTVYNVNSMREQARRSLGSARGWGLYDMFAGGFFSTMFKHSSMNKAESYLKDARTALRQFSRELDDVDDTIRKVTVVRNELQQNCF